MVVSNTVYHGGDGTNLNKSQHQKYKKEKEITSKDKNSGDRNDPAKLKRRLAKLAKKQQQEN